MRYSYENNRGELSIDSKKVFCDCLKNKNPLKLESFERFLKDCEELVRTDFQPSDGALANVRGNWYEWLFSVGSFWYKINHSAKIFLPIPNISSFDLYSLYSEKIYGFISDLRNKTKKRGVSLISSNPDFVILKQGSVDKSIVLDNLNVETLNLIDNFYKNYISKCDLSEIAAFVSIKTSLRPDRRLQLSHEGALTKAFFQHLKTRLWDIDVENLKYYACSMNISEADQNALKTVATHSILSVNSIPEPTVDLLSKVTNGKELESFFDSTLT